MLKIIKIKGRVDMAIYHSNVNFRKLIKDLADMYNYSIPEVILVELVANALDARATIIDIYYDIENSILVVSDNGEGMNEKQFKEYHDFAADLKIRGNSIGFAGLGAKISFNCASMVLTETKGQYFSGASVWYLNDKNELVWEERPETDKIKSHGTRVEVKFNENNLKPFNDEKDIENILIKHYFPLFDEDFLEFYEKIGKYQRNLRFFINGSELKKYKFKELFNISKFETFSLEYKGKKYGIGMIGITEEEFALGEECVGVGLCVYGKVVKFEFFQQFIGEISSRILGFVEVPVLITHLNTSKSDFIKGKHLLIEFNKYYEPIRIKFKEWLDKTGIKSIESRRNEDAVKLEMEIKKIIKEFPELEGIFIAANKSNVNVKNKSGNIEVKQINGGDITFPIGSGKKGEGESPFTEPGFDQGRSFVKSKDGSERATPISRKRSSGLRISFCDEKEKEDLAWIEGSTIILNLGHKSYRKMKSQARILHHIFSIAICLERKLKEDSIIQNDRKFVDEFMCKWGS